MPPRILVLIAHPNLKTSRVNRRLSDAIADLPGVTLRPLYELYPAFDVDVQAEQRLCETHDVIVLQHPFYWYSCPALMKEWMDRVLLRGWAYGDGGFALRGKALMSALSANAPRQAYAHDGKNRHTILEFLAPFEQAARLCYMRYLPPFVVFNARLATDADIAAAAGQYRERIQALLAEEAFQQEAWRDA